MKKKKILFIVALLLIVAIPFYAVFSKFEYSPSTGNKLFASASSTDSSNYVFSNGSVGAYYITGSNTIPGYCIRSGVCKDSASKFWLAEAIYKQHTSSEKFYHAYCLQFGLRADGAGRPALTAYTYKNHFDNNVIRNHNGSYINENQRLLLEDLLASGYQYSADHSRTIYNLTNGDHAKRIFVKQILVWEIVEGARTNFDIVPNVYHASDSAYSAVISKKNNLTEIYKAELAAAKEYRAKRETGAPIFGKEYFMRWNSNTNRYEAVITESLNGFNDCKADRNDITITKRSVGSSSEEVVVSSPNSVDTPVTITCSYKVGSGNSEYTYYKFSNHSDYQELINGVGGSTINKSFTVRTETSKIYINKVNLNGQKIKETAKFTLTLNGDASVNIPIDGNSSAKTLEKSGVYILHETAPHGYVQIPDTELNIDIKAGKITSSNNKVVASYDSAQNQFNLIVYNTKKTFDINKVNENGAPLNGAVFEIYNGSNFNNKVKFTKDKNTFTYSDSGNVTSIQDPAYSTYFIELLPKGIYKVVEADVPGPYIVATNIEDRTYFIQVKDDYNIFDCGKDSSCKNAKLTVKNSITIKNYRSKIEINKTGAGGKPLAGVKFLLVDSGKSVYIVSNQSQGQYTFLAPTVTIGEATIYTTDANGKIYINDLPVGTYYLKEIETVDPYVLPEGDDAYTKLVVEMTTNGPKLNGKTSCSESISNSTNEFNFYKVDENGNYLSGGKFKLQKYNDEKGKYEDIKLVSVENDGSYLKESDVFKEDDKKGKVQFTLAHGIATFIEMSPGTTYRIVELEAPTGFEVANVDNSAVIKIDKRGYAKGSATIVNQLKSLEGSTAQAELVIEIQTGKKVVRYGMIIAGTLILIGGLMVGLIYISKKRK